MGRFCRDGNTIRLVEQRTVSRPMASCPVEAVSTAAPVTCPASELHHFCAPGAEKHTVGCAIEKYVTAGTTNRNCRATRPAEGLENYTAVLRFVGTDGKPSSSRTAAIGRLPLRLHHFADLTRWLAPTRASGTQRTETAPPNGTHGQVGNAFEFGRVAPAFWVCVRT
jgi:hypothetical protein